VLTRHALFPLRSVNKPLLRSARRLIAVSEAVAESVRRSGVIESSKIAVIHNGIDVDRFERSRSETVSNSKADFPILVGTVGHLAPIKGHDVFVRAAALIAARRRDVRFVIIGEDKSAQMQYRKALETLVAELNLGGIVEMPGWRDDMPAMLASLTLFVSAARSEPFGLAIVEAMAAGLPIVAAASEGASDIIEHGATGRLVPVDDPVALAQAITDLLNDPAERARLAHNAAHAARECYSLQRMAGDTERVYREALAGT
jgi:glycosyltransferase involved in cell wall biosynthesis